MPITTQAQWSARQHETVSKRSRKGVTSQRVTRFGAAAVVGAWDVDSHGRPLLATTTDEHTIEPAGAAARVLAQAFERGEIHRHAAGWSALDIERLTDAILASDDDMPTLQGTDVRQYAQVIHTDRLDAVCQAAARTSGLSGQYRDTNWDWFAAHRSAYGRQTALKAWPTRRRITIRKRASDPIGPTTLQWLPERDYPTVHPMGRGYCMWRVTELPAAGIDESMMFIGHRAHHRTAAIKRTTRQLAARTIGTVPDMPETLHALEILVASLAPGERVTIGEHVTITRGKSGQYAATDRRPGRELKLKGQRTAHAVALRLG